ncbi:zinc finger protein 62 homolog isoform X2 [Scleropages formosus]|uniref:zinc finger protein 62 homolog isoform X2 n=1 Tax=Scleropages formosus TaxID=113540 RepID=UPI000878B3F4|nr:zinc finger protein 62 homolog isoform X2 [Scleropages formosus]
MAMFKIAETEDFLNKQCDVVIPDTMPGEEYMDTHIQEDTSSKFKCEQCGRCYRHAGSLANHKKTHEVGSFHCPVCARVLSNALALKNHVRIHTSSKNFSCSECGKAFRLATQLATHHKVHTSKRSSRESPQKVKRAAKLPQENGEMPDSSKQNFNSMEDPDMEFDSIYASTIMNGDMNKLGNSDNSAEKPFDGSDSVDRPFKCDQCDKTYRHHGSLINHKKSHQLGAFECPVCYKQFNNLAALTSHQRTHTKSKFRTSTLGVGVSPQAVPDLTVSSSQNENAATCYCHLCEVVFPNSSSFQDHILLHNAASSAGEVPESFSDSDYSLFLGSQTRSCPSPTLLPKQEMGDQTPGSTVTRQKYTCAYCGEGYTDLESLKDHYLSHNSLSTSNCQTEPSVLDPKHLNNGSESHTAIPSFTKEAKETEGSSGNAKERRFTCQICGKSYRHAGSLINHKRTHQTEEETWRKTQEVDGSLTICSTCGESFSRESDLQAHQLLHGQDVAAESKRDDDYSTVGKMEGKSTICGNCGMFCTNYNQLEAHQCVTSKGDKGQKLNWKEQGTNEEKLEKGADCGGRGGFQQRPDSEDRPHRCDQCGRSYRHPSSLLNHKKSHKTGVFRCFVCQKRFYNLLALKSHHRSHFDLKRHKCEQCGKAFKIQKQLVNHLKIHEKKRTRGRGANQQLQNFAQIDGSENGQSLNMLAKSRTGRSQTSAMCSKCGKIHSWNKPCPNKDAHQKVQNEGAFKNKIRLFACDQCAHSYCHARSLANHKKIHHASVSNPGSPKSRLNGASNQKSSAVHVSPQTDERPFVCDICNRTYRHAGSLLNHKNTHKTGNFSCSFCSKPFYNAMALRNHTRIHTQKKKHICNTCGKAFRLASILLNHQKVHMQRNVDFSCPTCGKSYMGKSGLKRHRCGKNQERISKGVKNDVKAGEGRENRFTCEQCGRSYRHASSLLNHKNTHTTGIYHCVLCLKTFSNLLALKNHRRIHSETRRHSCPDCNKTFRVSSQLRSHRRVHVKERELACIPCQRSFPSRVSFRRHQELHSQAQQLPLQDVLGEELDWGCGPDLILSAPGQGSDGEPRLAAHSSCASSRLPQLPLQQESFVEAVHKMHVCEHCGRAYRHASSLLNHKNSHKVGSFVCSTCQKEFSNLMALKNHRRIHTEPKRYVCSDCGKAFRVSTQLICHQRVHTKEKPFPCPYCGKSFSSKSNLRHHQKVHQNTLEAPLDMGTSAFLGLGIDSYL